MFDTALTIDPRATVGEALLLLPKRSHGVIVAVNADGAPVGTATKSDLEGMDRFAQVHEAMSTDLTVVSADATPTEVFDRLSAHRHRAALAVTDDRLVGLMTIKGALRAALYSPACLLYTSRCV